MFLLILGDNDKQQLQARRQIGGAVETFEDVIVL